MARNVNFSAPGLDRWRATLDRHINTGGVPGLVAVACRRDDVHVHATGQKALGGGDSMRRDTIFRIASMSKPVAAVAAMILVEECVLRLDDPVECFLPELSNRRVLARLDGPLADTVPAHRPITLHDLLTLRMGLGHIMADTSGYPIQQAINEAGVLQGPPRPRELPPPDVWMQRVGALPLMHQPGEQWMYDLGLDVLGVLIARASGQALDRFMRERIFGPLGMTDTGFFVPPEKLSRLSTSHVWNPATSRLDVYDGVENSDWAEPPAFPSAAGGLVSTADDYLAFCRMLLNLGRLGRERILSRRSVELMTMDHLTPAQRASNRIFLGDHSGWGFGVSVNVSRGDLHETPGRFGWDGGLGTTGYTDPAEGVIGILLTQRNMDSPEPPKVFVDFWTLLYQALDT